MIHKLPQVLIALTTLSSPGLVETWLSPETTLLPQPLKALFPLTPGVSQDQEVG